MTPWRMVLPLAVVLALALAWCAYWLIAVEAAKREYAGIAGHGLRLDCQREQWTGFPFRITLICDRPAFRLGSGEITVAGHGSALSVTALAYRPTHVIAELAAPSSLTHTRTASATGSLPDRTTLISERGAIRVGAHLGHGGVNRLSGRLSGWAGRISAMKAGHMMIEAAVEAGFFAVHWGPDGDTADARLISVEASAVAASGISASGQRSGHLVVDRAEIAAAIAGATDDAGRFALADLKAWQAADGEVEIRHLVLAQGDREIAGTGEARLDARGRIEGKLDLAVKEMGLILGDLISAGHLQPDEAIMARTAIELLARGAPAPRPGWSRVPVKLSRGRLYFGPFKVAVLAPLY